MGIGILIVVIGSLIYKGRYRIQKIFDKYRNKYPKKVKNQDKNPSIELDNL